MRYEVFTKYTKQIYGTQFGYHNHMSIPLYVTELIQLLSLDINGRYTDFWFVNGKMINQLDACQFEKHEMFLICVKYVSKRL